MCLCFQSQSWIPFNAAFDPYVTTVKPVDWKKRLSLPEYAQDALVAAPAGGPPPVKPRVIFWGTVNAVTKATVDAPAPTEVGGKVT